MTQADEDSVPEVIGRVASGTVLAIVGAAIGLASLFLYVGGVVFPWIPEWMFLEDLLLIPGAMGLGLLIAGFTIMTRTRKRRAAEAAEEAAFLAARAAGVGDDGNPNRIPPSAPSAKTPPPLV